MCVFGETLKTYILVTAHNEQHNIVSKMSHRTEVYTFSKKSLFVFEPVPECMYLSQHSGEVQNEFLNIKYDKTYNSDSFDST